MKLAVDAQRNRRLRTSLIVVLVVIAAIPSVGWVIARPAKTIEQLASRSNAGSAITAPGRIEPQDGVLTIAPPVAEFGSAIVATLQVRPGDWVREGQTLATLTQHAEAEAAVIAAQRRVAVARAKLSALHAGGKEDDIKALRADIGSDEAMLAHTEAETKRAQQLREERLLSESAVEAQKARLAAATRALEAKRSRLEGLSSVRPADVAIAQAELAAAGADVETMRARLANTIMRAPADGRVLAVHAYPGQRIGEQGVVAFGRTNVMIVDAEVVESDVSRARVGQKVRIAGDVLSAATTGTVEEIGYLVGTRAVFDTDPTAFADSRIVHVKIRADEPQVLERFINARVTVAIEP